MFVKAAIGLTAIMVMAAGFTEPAFSQSSGARSRPMPSSVPARLFIPAPAYGIRGDGLAHSINPAHDVYLGYKYSGADPDPFIRSQLAHDPPWNNSK
jgi:hypothetical protein